MRMSDRELFTTNRLFCPGPTPSPWLIKQAALESDIYHRSKEFERLVLDCARMLKPLFGTSQEPLILTSSGTGAMEAVVTNLTSAGDHVMVVNGGKFGERWQKINYQYGNKVSAINVAAGSAPTEAQIESALKANPDPKVFFVQANETSTGARYDIAMVSRVLRRHAPGALLAVDAISSLGAHAADMDALGIDAVVAGSQKGFGVAPGLSFVTLSQRAWGALSDRPRFYFDLTRERKGQESGRTAFTPAIGLIQSLHASLTEMERIGVARVIAHHQRVSRATRAAVKAMGLSLFVTPDAVSDALTAIKVPDGLDGTKVLTQAKSKYGAIISGGQDELKGRIIRFSHLGFVSPMMLIDGLASLEFALADCGYDFKIGSGVAAAMEALREN